MKIGPAPNDRLWLDDENFRRHARYAKLTEAEKAIVEAFGRDGCYHWKNALGGDLVEALNAAIDDWMIANIAGLKANKRADGTFPRLIGLHGEIPAVAALFAHEGLRKLRNLLFGRTEAFRTTITFVQGSQQPLHRDIPVFRVSPGGLYFRIWCALEDTTPLNGALTGVRGGHRIAAGKHEVPYCFYARFEEMPEQDPVRWQAYQETLKRQYDAAGLTEETFELHGGDVLIWHPLFPHGGSVIADKRSGRRSVVLHFSTC